MKNVRKDVVVKLVKGLKEKRNVASTKGASLPKRFEYNTKNAKHFVFFENGIYYCNSEMYDGTRCHSEVSA